MNPYDTGSLIATIALLTVAGDILSDEWKREEAKPMRTAGVTSVTLFVLTKDWNFFQPDSY